MDPRSIYLTLIVSAAVILIAAEFAWAAGRRRRAVRPLPVLDDARLSFLWTGVPVFFLLCLSSVAFRLLK